jgi:23S rRNA (cytosine1962-C5)-methyltransferase
MEEIKVILKSGKDQSLRRYHPWVFSGAIKKIKGQPAEGDVVHVYDNKDELLGIGHYQIGSIAVRIISFSMVRIDKEFWRQKLQKALWLRQSLGLMDNPDTNVFRLINAEGDGFPGLIADYYNGVLVVQAHSIGMFKILNLLSQLIIELLENRITAIYNKSSSTLPYKADIIKDNYYIFDKSKTFSVKENGLAFDINWEEGQKTGFYIDQRGNRLLLRQFSKDKKVLNLFGYTGGFSVYALSGGCNIVDTVDSSRKAIELADKNIEENFGPKANHSGIVYDAFNYLDETNKFYDVMVLDPPAFAKHHNVLQNALQGYKKLNRKAIAQINEGGILFTFSCSQVVSKENFRKMIFTAAAGTGRQVRILYQMDQPPDHPVSVYHPEGEYLKGLVLKID